MAARENRGRSTFPPLSGAVFGTQQKLPSISSVKSVDVDRLPADLSAMVSTKAEAAVTRRGGLVRHSFTHRGGFDEGGLVRRSLDEGGLIANGQDQSHTDEGATGGHVQIDIGLKSGPLHGVPQRNRDR